MKINKTNEQNSVYKYTQGFVLIEVLVAVAIVGILATFSFFSYQRYGVKKDVTNGQQYLLELQQKQGIYFLNNREYAKTAEELGMSLVPEGSETAFEPIKIFFVKGDDINLPGGDFFTAALDFSKADHPPLLVSEDGRRWFEYTDECYSAAGIGDEKSSFNIADMDSYEVLKVIAACRFGGVDKRWDEDSGSDVANSDSAGGAGAGNVGSSTNPIQVYYNSLPESLTGQPPAPLPSTDPNCDAADKNKAIVMGNERSFIVNDQIRTCSCTQDSVSMGLSSGKVECVRYKSCGNEPETYIEERVLATCETKYDCNAVTKQVNGVVGANVKTNIIYADPDNNGFENGYKVWCSSAGILSINTTDPTLSTCYGAVCSIDQTTGEPEVSMDEGNNLAKYEVEFDCGATISNSYPADSFTIHETTTGDLYEVYCPIGNKMTKVENDDFRDSTCTSYYCDEGDAIVDEITSATVK